MKKVHIFIVFCFLGIVCSGQAEKSINLRAVRIEINNGYRIDYLDKNGDLTVATDKGYASITYAINQGRIEEEFYFDENRNPSIISGYHGKKYIYNEGNSVRIVYCDRNHFPVNNSSGYAIVERIFNDKKNVIKEKYYDKNGEPIRLSNGQYGLLRTEFDEYNRVRKIIYID